MSFLRGILKQMTNLKILDGKTPTLMDEG